MKLDNVFGKAPRGNVRGVATVGQALGCTSVLPWADTLSTGCYCKQVPEVHVKDV